MLVATGVVTQPAYATPDRERRRIELDRLLEEGNRLEYAFLAALVPTVSALQVERVGLEVVRIALRRGIRDVGQESGAQRAHDGPGDLVLNGEHVVQRTIVALRPEVAPVVGRGELRRDAQPITRLPHRPLEHGRDAEQGADGADVLRLSLEGKRGRARGDPQAVDLGERVDQLVADG